MSTRTQSSAPKARPSLAQANALGTPTKNGSSPEGAQQPLALRRQLVPATLDLLLGAPNPDAEMGQQLTEQYHRATGGMVEVLKFGAMMMMLESNVSARGHALISKGGRGSGGEGLKGWLAEHAPEVKRPTAYRFMHVAEAIAAESYAQLVGAKTARQLALQDLVTAPADSLSPALRKKQEELFDFVSGTSQRSWLDRFKPETRKVGQKPKCQHCGANLKTKDQPLCPKCGKSTGAKPPTAEEQRASLIESFHAWADAQLNDKTVEHGLFKLGDDQIGHALVAHWREQADKVDAWLKTPKRRRSEMTLEEVLS